MVTTSDDKKILIWEWDIGVPIKYISEPEMQSMPAVCITPNGSFFLGQSLDNEIKCYDSGGKFTLVRKKKFKGHQIAGYACEISISNSGKFVASGDGGGKLVFWDWNTGKMMRTINAHDKGPTISCSWHPIEPSLMVTCGWDGVIKLWE
jgi:pre-mRNA-processing factor 17